jgi:agmatine deiminase
VARQDAFSRLTRVRNSVILNVILERRSREVEVRRPVEDSLKVPIRTVEHARTFVSWPWNGRLWGGHLEAAAREYADVIAAIAEFEPVTVIARPGTAGPTAAVRDLAAVSVVELELDDSWIRDNGPIFVRDDDGNVAAVRFGFNGWGEFSPAYEADALLPARLAERLAMRLYEAPIVLEGGGITFDGEGTAITTESVLLNANRNPGMGRAEVERAIREYLGAERVIWLSRGLVEEDGLTDGHSDNVVQFVRPGMVLVQMVSERSNPNWELLRENRDRLRHVRDAAGRRLEIVEMPVLPYTNVDGQRYVVPYTNFYPVNGGVIAPLVDEQSDETGLGLLGELFSDRRVVGVRSDYLAFGGGGIGCITQQLPAGTPLPRRRPLSSVAVAS